MSAPSSRSFVLTLVGLPALRDASGASAPFRTRKHLAVLLRLAWDAPRAVPRDVLATQLWGSSAPRPARHSLSQAISALRVTLGREAIRSSSSAVQLVGPIITLDFRQQAFDIDALEGGIIQGFSIRDAPEFEQWLDQVRDQVWREVQPRLHAAILDARRSGCTRRVARLSDILCRYEPYSERGVGSRMWAQRMAGDRTGALETFEAYAARLAHELRTVPSHELQRAAESLRTDTVERRIVRERIASPTPDLGAVIPVIGRDDEHRRLYDAWQRVIDQGHASAVLVTGETGVGRSTLLMRVGAAIEAGGHRVLAVRCGERDLSTPYAMAARLVEGLVQCPGAAASPTPVLRDLARISPRIWREFPGIGTPTPLRETDTLAARLRAAIADLILAVTDEQPVALLVDDLDIADHHSQLLVQGILDDTRNAALFLCATQPQGTSRSIGEAAWTDVVALTPLAGSAAITMAKSILAEKGGAPDDALVRRCVRLSAGNPLALELLIDDVVRFGDTGLLRSVGEIGPAQNGGIPRRWPRTLLVTRCDRLSESTRQVLNIAAVLDEFGEDLTWFSGFGIPPSQLAEASRELVAVGLWASHGGQLGFRHWLHRMAAYESIPLPVRTWLHRGAYSVLHGLPDRGSPRRAIQLARHASRAGLKDSVAGHGLVAARGLLDQWAVAEAADILSDLTDVVRAGTEESTYRYLRGRVASLRGQHDQAQSDMAAAVNGLLSPDDRLIAQLTCLEAAAQHSEVDEDFDDMRIIRVIAESAEKKERFDLAVRALNAWARLLAARGKGNEFEVVRAQIEQIGLSGRCLGYDHLGRGFIAAHQGKHIQAVAHLNNALRKFQGTHNREGIAESANGIGFVYHNCGDWRRANEAFQKSHEAYASLDHLEGVRRTQSNLAGLALVTGDCTRATELIEAVMTENAPAKGPPDRVQLIALTNAIEASVQGNASSMASEYSRSAAHHLEAPLPWRVKTALLLALADSTYRFGSQELAFGYIQSAAQLVSNRVEGMIEPSHLIRLETLRILQTDGLNSAREWLRDVSMRRVKRHARSRVVIRILNSWLSYRAGKGPGESFQEEVETARRSGALGTLSLLQIMNIPTQM